MEGPVVLDTSVVIKWFRQGEVLAGQALQLRGDYLDGRIAVALPSLLAYELANVLHYKAGRSAEPVRHADDLGPPVERDDGAGGRPGPRPRDDGL